MATLPAVLIAAPFSGSGKTTLTTGIVRALTHRGKAVAPFKVGPDYIDPTYHALAAGRPCHNLDSWMLGEDGVQTTFTSGVVQDTDIAIIEGVMGLFDGATGEGITGSSAHIALMLDIPVILVIDARGMAHSAAALVKGYKDFDSRLNLAGVILNRVGSARHAKICQQSIETETGVPVVGYIERNVALQIPERHLGLVPTAENGDWELFIETTALQVAQTVDLELLQTIAAQSNYQRPAVRPQRSTISHVASQPLREQPSSLKIALAKDAAFSFTYAANETLLTQAGATLLPFSPLQNEPIPEDADMLILSGGFPELYARQLSKATNFFASLDQFRGFIYAECGGLMVLTQGIIDQQDQYWPMAGLLSGMVRMTDKVTLGYRQVTAMLDSPLFAAGDTIRGHEFHYSNWLERPDYLPYAYKVEPRSGLDGFQAGVRTRNILASYIHLNFHAKPEIVERLLNHAVVARAA